ncbi:MAG: hypothetical protein V4663_13080 [Bacteroidota bacterium]
MRNNYMHTTYSGSTRFAFILIVFFGLSVQLVNAQTFYKAVSASQLKMAIEPVVESSKGIKSEGAYLIKDGQLDEIYRLKLILPTMLLDSVLKDKKITFEQTRVMILPIMGMVHFVGTLDVDGIKSTTSFQLGFIVNSDQSITFKGTKLLKLSDLFNDLPKDELKLDIDFVLKNSKSNLAVLTSK